MQMIHGLSADCAAIVARIEAEFRAWPGLRLTRGQVRRLWHLSDQECVDVLEALLSRGFVVLDLDGQYTASPDRT